MTASVSSNPLISRERSQKLELLNHLIANLAHAIVVCGPEGVGKTFLLKAFQKTTKEPWLFCWINSDNQLGFENIQEILAEKIAYEMPEYKETQLSKTFERVAARDIKIVLVLDDAGKLAPGLIEKIISYAERKPVLRVIITLTHSEIYLKNSTDPAIDDCYQIDIPPFSEKQCGDFLEYLSTLQNPRIQFSAINESMVAALYRETHGIPGNILAHLPSPDSEKKKDYTKTILFSAVAALIVIALGVQWWSSRPKKVVPETTAVASKPIAKPNIQLPAVAPAATAQATQPQVFTPLPPVAQTPPVVAPPPAQNLAQPINNTQATVIRNDVISNSHTQAGIEEGLKQQTIQTPPVPNPAPAAVANPSQQQVDTTGQVTNPTAAPADKTTTPSTLTPVATQVAPITVIPTDEGGRWLVGQPAENITLQLMALSNEQAILEVMQRHQALGQNLKYMKTKTRSGRDRFILLYGSFSTPELAHSEGKVLPREFQKPWMRKISVVQSELASASAIPTDTPD